MNNSFVVYTCILDGYDILKPIGKRMFNVDYICFTNNTDIIGDGVWKFRPVPEELLDLPIVKQQRLIKICPHRYLSEYTKSLWIDGNVKLNGNLNEILNGLDLDAHPLYTCRHRVNKSLKDESMMIISLKKDKYETIAAQLYDYKEAGFPDKGGMVETNVILRKHMDQRCIEFDEMWAHEVRTRSHRDQMSFNFCAWKLGFSYGLFKINFRSTNNVFSIGLHNRSIKIAEKTPPKPTTGRATILKQKDELKKIEFTGKVTKEYDYKPAIQTDAIADAVISNASAAIEDYKAKLSGDVVSVVFATHNRTRVACACLSSLIQNLKCDCKIKWIICDDRSEPGHIEALEHQCKTEGIPEEDVIVCRTDSEHWGLGASMNNGLKKAFEFSDIVMTTEDDWYLHDEYNISKFVDMLKSDQTLAGIRIGAMCPQCGRNMKASKYNEFLKVEGGLDPNGKWYVFNNQVMIRHKRVFDKIGFMKENCSADEQEKDLTSKFNQLTDFGRSWKFQVLWPKIYDIGTLYGLHNPFYHIGESTTEGKHRVVRSEFKSLNDKDLDAEFRRKFTMDNKERIIVSMTSYPKNICNVAKAIDLILTKQTLKPDEIHLWLAIEEFPNKENNLPTELLKICENDKVFLHWVEKNTFVHKRHEYFKIAKQSDCVFFMDDDTIYDSKLIETVMNTHRKYPKCIICYNDYSMHKYDGRRILYTNTKFNREHILNIPHINKFRWCGQSMIPASIYPIEALSNENQTIRNKTSPISDECWLQPWIVYNNIPIYYHTFGWGIDIAPHKINGQQGGIKSFSHKKDSNGYEKRDNWLNAVLTAYPNFMKKYIKGFNYGK